MRHIVLTVSVVFGLFACSSGSATGVGNTTNAPKDGTSDTGGTSGAAAPTTAECTSRCATKLGACGAPDELIQAGCAQLCGSTVTAEQLTCFEGTACKDFGAENGSIEKLCAKPSSGSTGSTGSGSSGGTCKATKSCDGKTAVAIKCLGTRPVTERVGCPNGCEGGDCITLACIGIAGTCSGTPIGAQCCKGSCREPVPGRGRTCCIADTEACETDTECCDYMANQRPISATCTDKGRGKVCVRTGG